MVWNSVGHDEPQVREHVGATHALPPGQEFWPILAQGCPLPVPPLHNPMVRQSPGQTLPPSTRVAHAVTKPPVCCGQSVRAEHRVEVISSENPMQAPDTAVPGQPAGADRVDGAAGAVRRIFYRQTHFQADGKSRKAAAFHPQITDFVVILPGNIVGRADVDIVFRLCSLAK